MQITREVSQPVRVFWQILIKIKSMDKIKVFKDAFKEICGIANDKFMDNLEEQYGESIEVNNEDFVQHMINVTEKGVDVNLWCEPVDVDDDVFVAWDEIKSLQ